MTKTTFKTRFKDLEPKLHDLYKQVYTNNIYYDIDKSYQGLIDILHKYDKARIANLKQADITNPNWYEDNSIVGTTLYVDLFSGDFKSFISYIPYFEELGINLIHFMPILESREGENDGGYAVKNYKSIDPKFGSNKDFEVVIAELKKANIHVCIDFVVNHTAKEHAFAKKALAGDINFMNMYLMYDSEEIPNQFDQTVPEVFPKVAPGNFTYYETIHKWVFTSFYEFQWDLNYHNPLVFESIIDILLHLSNKGIDMIRLDAIPFMWKQLGHSCRNHPTIHKLLAMFNLIIEIVAPSVALLGEAIVEPEEIIKYCGEDIKECSLMYNATHMVNIWNSMATRDTRMLQTDVKRLTLPSNGVWINYARCHDDIGWGFNEAKLSSMGFDPFAHKQFLINFYHGTFEGSFSKGELYEFNPQDLDARNCGTMASLLGLENAIANKDMYQTELALKRINLTNALIISASGIPLIYSGDELGILNDYSYIESTKKKHDSRWIHRPSFDHNKAKSRLVVGTHEYTIFNTLKHFIDIRKKYSIFSSKLKQQVLDTANNHLYCFYKQSKDDLLVNIFNFSEDRQVVSTNEFNKHQITGKFEDMITGKIVDFNTNDILLGPYEYLWLKRV